MPNKGNGKTRLQNLALEGQCIIEELKREFTAITAAQTAIAIADYSNDPDLSAALVHLKNGRTLENPTQKDCELNTAQVFLESAIQKDFDDPTIDNMKAMLLPFEQKISALAEHFCDLQEQMKTTPRAA